MTFAVAGILGHNTKTMLLFFAPQCASAGAGPRTEPRLASPQLCAAAIRRSHSLPPWKPPSECPDDIRVEAVIRAAIKSARGEPWARLRLTLPYLASP